METEAPPPAQKRGFPLARAALGLVLAAGALALVFWPRAEDQLAVAWRFEPAGIAPGTAGSLLVSVKPGPGAPEGSRLVCNEDCRPSVVVAAAPADVVFKSGIGSLHARDDEVPLDFTVKEGAAPGEREVVLHVEAELTAAGKTITWPTKLRRSITLTIGPPKPKAPAPKGKSQ